MLLHGKSLTFCVGLTFPRFRGEPDGGLAFDNQRTPFCLIETGYSDSGKLTRSRAMHWIVRGQPGVNFLTTYVLMFTGEMVIEHQDRCRTTATDQISNSSFSFHYRTSRRNRNKIHSAWASGTLRFNCIDFICINVLTLQDLLDGARTHLTFPFEDLDQLPGSTNLIRPIPRTITVDFFFLVLKAQQALLW